MDTGKNAIEVQANDAMNNSEVMLEQVRAMTVNTPDEEETAAKIMVEARSKTKAIEAWFKPQIESAHHTHRELCNKKNDAVKPYSMADKILAEKVRTYRAEIRRQQAEAEAKARAEAEAKAKKEQEKLEKQAAKAEEKGLEEKAEGLRDQAQAVAAAPMPSLPRPGAVKTGAGTLSPRMTLKMEVLDMEVFVRAIADGLIPVSVIQIHHPSLKKWAELRGMKTGIACGVKFWQEEEFSARKSR